MEGKFPFGCLDSCIKGNFPFFDRLDQIVKHRATNNLYIRRKICNDKFLNAMNIPYIRSKLYNE